MENTEKLLSLLKKEEDAKKMIFLKQNNMLVGETGKITAFVVERFFSSKTLEEFKTDIDKAINTLRNVKRSI